ncbi:MAG TPA: 23S rRNA pseudouridine(1911/1915/1917) synthase RluD [Gammaproteobacteria bacterium]|nr:23S rRNA pseudouridine(1911/1915/1917) synthase RluD [Gammaproteobacteria bacterium]
MTTPEHTITLNAFVPEDLHGLRLDQALARLFPEHSRSRLKTWNENKHVQVNHQYLRAKDKIAAGQYIHINATLPVATDWQPQNMQLSVVYADTSLIIVNKPIGQVVHPAAGNPDNTLVNALLHFDPSLASLPRAGIVHRLDKDTSGLLVIARNLCAHTHLINQMQTHAVTREYIAIVNGTLTGGGTIAEPIGRHPTQRTHMAVVASGKPAITHYRINERFPAHTCINVMLETGRTHQIRVHMAYIGHPLLGDQTYGGRLKIPAQCSDNLKQCLQAFKRQALHAKKLTLTHPETNELMSWETELPDDLETLLNYLREHKNSA